MWHVSAIRYFVSSLQTSITYTLLITLSRSVILFVCLFNLRPLGGVSLVSPSTIIFLIFLHFYHNTLSGYYSNIKKKRKTSKLNMLSQGSKRIPPASSFPSKRHNYSQDTEILCLLFEPRVPQEGPLTHLYGKEFLFLWLFLEAEDIWSCVGLLAVPNSIPEKQIELKPSVRRTEFAEQRCPEAHSTQPFFGVLVDLWFEPSFSTY